MSFNLIRIEQLKREEVLGILKLARNIESETRKYFGILNHKMLGILFFQPSTRTRIGFSVAMQNLGGGVVYLYDTKFTKGMSARESLEDTVRVIGDYCDVLCIRHSIESTLEKVCRSTHVPIINCGNGTDQHPTQALIDLYTIWKEFGRLDNLRLAVIGDLKHMRTAHSLILGLSLFRGNKLKLISPKELRLPDKYLKRVEDSLEISETDMVELRDEDVVYVAGLPPFGKGNERLRYQIDKRKALQLKEGAIILNPLPRVDEITREVDSLRCARYFEQSKNGLYVRMAILTKILRG